MVSCFQKINRCYIHGCSPLNSPIFKTPKSISLNLKKYNWNDWVHLFCLLETFSSKYWLISKYQACESLDYQFQKTNTDNFPLCPMKLSLFLQIITKLLCSRLFFSKSFLILVSVSKDYLEIEEEEENVGYLFFFVSRRFTYLLQVALWWCHFRMDILFSRSRWLIIFG